jgi:hypothetical protein
MNKKENKKTVQDIVDTNSESAAAEDLAPRQLTFSENLILTIKVLVGFGLLGAALWGISVLKTGS